MASTPKTFPSEKFELLLRSYLDKLVDREVLRNFALAHIDDEYEPEFQRPVEDLHLLFLPEVNNDAEAYGERSQIRYLLGLWEVLKQDVTKQGLTAVRQRELERIAAEDPTKHSLRAQHRDRHRRRDSGLGF